MSPFRLSWVDIRLLVVVAVLEVAIGVSVRLVGMAVVRRGLARLHVVVPALIDGRDDRIVWAIEAIGRRLPWLGTCLVRALVAEFLLARSDRPGSLHIGVRRTPSGALDAHAWFERDGRVLIGGGGSRGYEPLLIAERQR
jgi:hypothetical protein